MSTVPLEPGAGPDDGFVGPVGIFSHAECRTVAGHLRHGLRPPSDWSKGHAVSDPFLYGLAVRPSILSIVANLLGNEVVLWGASAVRRRPGQAHPWHTDIESSSPAGGFVSVWIGIENTSRESALQIISGSHRFGATIQQVAQEHGRGRGEASAEDVLRWAEARDRGARLLQPDMQDGDALFFDGRLWHGSHNTRHRGERLALLLQYARADVPVRIPDFSRVEWPFRFREAPRPPVLLVRGRDTSTVNRVVPPPGPGKDSMSAPWIHRLTLPLAAVRGKGWTAHPISSGATPRLDEVECHASVLGPGGSPHPPHIHPEEEVLIVLDGEGEIVLADDPHGTNERVERLGAGSFAYYPSGQHHTIRNGAERPVTYLMFKWLARATGRSGALGTRIVRVTGAETPGGRKEFETARLLHGPTACLDTLHAHLSLVYPGGGYEPHADAHDVALVVLDGRVETLGEMVERHGVVYCPAGSLHGLRNTSEAPARYLVFEFHAAGGGGSGSRLLRRVRWAGQRFAGRASRAMRRARRALLPG